MSERRDSTRSLVSWEKATLACGSHAQWNGSDGQTGQFVMITTHNPHNALRDMKQPLPDTTVTALLLNILLRAEKDPL